MHHARISAADHEPESEDGPFVSFTDLLSGILFIFLILIAALMLMQRNNVDAARRTAEGTVTIGNKQMTAKELYEFGMKFLTAQGNKIDQLQRANEVLTAERASTYRRVMLYNVYKDHEAFNGDKSGRLYYNHTSVSYLSSDRTKIFFEQEYFAGIDVFDSTYEDNGEPPRRAANPQPPSTREQAEHAMKPCDVRTATRQKILYVCGDGFTADFTRVAPDRYAGTFRHPGKMSTRFELRILAIYDEEFR